MTTKNKTIRFKKYPDIGNLELLHAAYTKTQFKPHFHEGHAIGVIEKGQLGFDYRGQQLVANEGDINLVDPGEVHNGFCVSEKGWQYRMFYLAHGQIQEICDEVADKKTVMPFFQKGIINDKRIAQKIMALHRDFERSDISLLEKESRFHDVIVEFVLRHCPEKPCPMPMGSEKKAVKKARTYIHEHYHTRISLEELSSVANVSRYYFLRIFAKETGLTPHEYLNLIRALNAKKKLNQGMPIVDVACDTGFFDQSHLNRIFKKIYGITPGIYMSCR
ncbi:MAG: AraC family transcriptional regulator [Desulfobacteraceae bacterium]|nr:AraC family transcriptional regulator [Desulfobacteraceae bacterium]